MTERITIAQQREMVGLANLRAPGSGRSLRDVAEAALEAIAPGEYKLVSEVSASDAVRYVVGIDPGVKTGFSVWDREGKRLLNVETADFWTVFFRVSNAPILRQENTLIVIEVAHYAPTFRGRKDKAENFNTMSRMARNVGQVTREAQLLVEGFRRLGYTVQEQKPLGKAKKAEDDIQQFQRLTGWTERTSQHARDAARMCFQR